MRRHAGIPPVLALLALCCYAQLSIRKASCQPSPQISSGEDLDALLKRMEANNRANNRLAARYTFDWTSRCGIHDRKGKLLSNSSAKWVTVTIDGVNYSRIVEMNGRPLSRRKQIAEQKRSDATGKMGTGYDFVFQIVARDPRDYIYSELPISYLDTLFDNRVIGHELINGRDTLIVESTPKVDAKPHSDREKTALDWRETTWIDIEDAMPARYDVKLVNRKSYLLNESTLSIQFARLPVTESGNSQLPPNVWLMQNDNALFIFWPANSEVLHDDYYNYKRFQSEAHVIDDSVQEVPVHGTGKQP